MKLFQRSMRNGSETRDAIFCIVIHVKHYFRSLNHILFKPNMNTRFTGFWFFLSLFRSKKVMTVAICKLIPLNSFTKTKRNKTSLLSSRFCIKPAEETSKIELFLCVLSPEEQVTFWKVINRWLHCYRVQCMYIWYDCAMQTNCSYIFT